MPFAPRTPPFADVAAFVRSGVQGSEARGSGRFHVVAVIEAPAAQVTARIGSWAEVEPRTETSCTFVMDVDDLDGPVFALGVTGAPFTVLEPPELVERVRSWSQRLAAAVGTPV